MTAPAAPLTRARVSHALDLLAGIIARSSAEDAARVAPIYDRLEQEHAAMERDDIRTRARARLAASIGSIVMEFEIVTETNLAIGPYVDRASAMAAAEEFGLGPMRDDLDDDRAPGWQLAIVQR